MSYNTIAGLLSAACGSGLSLPQIILKSEIELTGKSEAEVFSSLDMRLEVMRSSAKKALNAPQSMPLMLISGQSERQWKYSEGDTISGRAVNRVMAYALSCSESNASMGRICAAPTAGSCGIVPAVLMGLSEIMQYSDDELRQALLVASGFGAVIMKNATVAGAEGGCQAECGTAAAMAAAAAVYLFGGSAEKCAEGASIALINVMGLVCDPVAGLVQLPCSFRNASGAVNALISADLALAGQSTKIPPDEVIEAMFKTGKKLPPELRETALGGIAATASAKAIAEKLN